MSDGSRLRQSWATALTNAEGQFRSLLQSASSSSWKQVPLPPQPLQGTSSETILANAKRKARLISTENLVMHRRSTKRGDVTRVVLDIPFEDPVNNLDKWRAVLSTPELRSEWDPAVESSSLVEMFDWNTQITKTNFALGWPANPRDAVTISKTFHDAMTLIDVSTSLPRSPDEPAYLRPAPPYVRSHVHLFAWCFQILAAKSSTAGESTLSSSSAQKLRITCLWQHDLKAVWSLSSPLSQQLPTMVQGLIRVVQKRGHRIPFLSAYGPGIILERISFELGREALNIDYAVIVEDEDEASTHAVKALEQVNEAKERKRLERTVEYVLPENTGWDIQVSTRASSDVIASLPWNATATHTTSSEGYSEYIAFRLRHSSLPDYHSVLKVKMVIELSGSSPGLRLNGLPHTVLESEPRNPTSYTLSRQLLQDTSSVSGLSYQSLGTGRSSGGVSTSSGPQRGVSIHDGYACRSSAAEKVILTRVRRNYIYFSSLLQEPEAKWKRTSESRGVTISQLDSIDPTLIVYRAEAVFVGVGLWDLYSTIASPGARVQWDKGYEDATLLEDVNELTELWHWRTKPNWPANARDVVLLKTVYKSPTTVHVFSFSTDDVQLFSSIPQADPSVIRTQVDLQGWAIETLSPTTTLLTLLEQSDPRGWAGKSSIPQQMINAVAGVGEFAIKCGGPPINTRLGGARSLSQRYDHEKGSFRLEYEGCESRRSVNDSTFSPSNGNTSREGSVPPSPDADGAQQTILPYIECEIRCDFDTWASSLDVVVDPPPQATSCLRRHRLSNRSGGLWLTICHDAVFVGEDRLLVIVRRGTSKEKGAVLINGSKIKVDVEEISENEIKALTKVKRVKPARFPLDQPPVLGVIRRRREEWNQENKSEKADTENAGRTGFFSWTTSAPQISSPLARFWTKAVEQTTATTSAAVNAATASIGSAGVPDDPLSASRPSMAHALSALAFLQSLHQNKSNDAWTLVADKGFPVYRKLFSQISTAVPVHKGEKVLEGVSAEEVAHVINNYESRAVWDDRFDSALVLQEFGAGCHTAFTIGKGGFPFRDRGFYLASITAKLSDSSTSTVANGDSSGAASPHPHLTTIFCASASFNSTSVEKFDSAKYNPHSLPIGRVMIQGWILETLDPYTTENYAIPSTRCTHVVSMDYAGAVPVTYNSMLNAAQPVVIPALEQYMKKNPALPLTRLPSSLFTIFSEDTSQVAGEAEPTNTMWKLEISDGVRKLVSSKYETSSKRFQATILLTPKSASVEISTPRPVPGGLPLLISPDKSLFLSTSSASSPASTIRSRRISEGASTIRTTRSLSRDAPRSPPPLAHGEGGISDLLVGELVVDSQLYRDGYEIRVCSQLRDAKWIDAPLSTSPISSTAHDLPMSCMGHILPSTPLHSSGLSIDAPPRHLLRFTLPTAKYQILEDDPLSLQPPATPSWLSELESKGALVEVTLQPIGSDLRRSKGSAFFEGKKLDIMGEKDSIRLLRRELEDERIRNMPKLSRIPFVAGSKEVPAPLVEPIAVATPLFDSKALLEPSTATGPMTGTADGIVGSDKDLTSGDDARSESTLSQHALVENTEGSSLGSNGLFRFWSDYHNTLFRRGSQTPERNSPGSSRASSAQSLKDSVPPSVASRPLEPRLYPLSTVLVIALISFLLGSLLRSLLTPAEFIYLSSDMNELEAGRDGWREIKRLLEFKRVFGGWDFLVGMVRRH